MTEFFNNLTFDTVPACVAGVPDTSPNQKQVPNSLNQPGFSIRVQPFVQGTNF